MSVPPLHRAVEQLKEFIYNSPPHARQPLVDVLMLLQSGMADADQGAKVDAVHELARLVDEGGQEIDAETERWLYATTVPSSATFRHKPRKEAHGSFSLSRDKGDRVAMSRQLFSPAVPTTSMRRNMTAPALCDLGTEATPADRRIGKRHGANDALVHSIPSVRVARTPSSQTEHEDGGIDEDLYTMQNEYLQQRVDMMVTRQQQCLARVTPGPSTFAALPMLDPELEDGGIDEDLYTMQNEYLQQRVDMMVTRQQQCLARAVPPPERPERSERPETSDRLGTSPAPPRGASYPSPSAVKVMGSFAASCSAKLLTTLEAACFDCTYDVCVLDNASNGRCLSAVFHKVLHHHDLHRRLLAEEGLSIDMHKLGTYVAHLEVHYGNNAYHNRRHAADVTLGVHRFLVEAQVPNEGSGGWAGRLSALECFAGLFAAMIHDYQHPGTTNAHEVSRDSELAITYHDESVLESHSLATAFRLLMHPDCRFLQSWDRTSYAQFRSLVIHLVLATDLSKHFEFIAALNRMPRAGAATPEPQGTPSPQSQLDAQLALTIAIKMADLGHSAKPWRLHYRWTLRVRATVEHRAGRGGLGREMSERAPAPLTPPPPQVQTQASPSPAPHLPCRCPSVRARAAARCR